VHPVQYVLFVLISLYIFFLIPSFFSVELRGVLLIKEGNFWPSACKTGCCLHEYPCVVIWECSCISSFCVQNRVNCIQFREASVVIKYY